MTFQANELLDWSTIHDRIEAAFPFEGNGRCPSNENPHDWFMHIIAWCKSEFGPTLLGEYAVSGVTVSQPDAAWTDIPFLGDPGDCDVIIRFRDQNDCLRFLLHHG